MRKTGQEIIEFNGESTGYTLGDFWSWAASNLLSNTLRGEYAEFIVAMALGIDLIEERESWASWDLTYPLDGKNIRLEVKSSSYLQAWSQKKPSLIQFGIKPARFLDSSGQYIGNPTRQSDIYVFCVYTEKNPTKINLLQLESWDFYILPTKVLNEKCGTQKTIGLSPLLKLQPHKADYQGIKAAVQLCLV